MKTHEEWVELFKECRKLFEDGTNYVRLHLGEFRDDDRWGFLEVSYWNLEISKKINKFCEENNLELHFHDRHIIRIEDSQSG